MRERFPGSEIAAFVLLRTLGTVGVLSLRSPAVAGYLVVGDDVDDEELSGLAPENNPIAAPHPRFEVVLVRLDRFDAKARRLYAFYEGENGLIAVALLLGREARIARFEPVGEDRRRE